MFNERVDVGRRTLIGGAAVSAVAAVAGAQTPTTPSAPETQLANVPLSAAVTITVERRDDIVVIGLNRPFIQNRLDPPTRVRLAEVFYEYEYDSSLRAALLFGHGVNFSRGIDVEASQAALIAGRRTLTGSNVIDPLGNASPHRTKPLVVVVHGDTWNLGHELYLAGDYPDRCGKHTIRPRREHSWPLPRWGCDRALRARCGLG